MLLLRVLLLLPRVLLLLLPLLRPLVAPSANANACDTWRLICTEA